MVRLRYISSSILVSLLKDQVLGFKLFLATGLEFTLYHCRLSLLIFLSIDIQILNAENTQAWWNIRNLSSSFDVERSTAAVLYEKMNLSLSGKL